MLFHGIFAVIRYYKNLVRLLKKIHLFRVQRLNNSSVRIYRCFSLFPFFFSALRLALDLFTLIYLRYKYDKFGRLKELQSRKLINPLISIIIFHNLK